MYYLCIQVSGNRNIHKYKWAKQKVGINIWLPPKLSECKSFIYYIDDTHRTNYNTRTELEGQNHLQNAVLW